MQRLDSYGRPFLLYLCGQGALNLGESLRFIAVTVLLYKLTGSGVSTALGLVFSALPNLLLSPFAGAAGDMLDEKKLLAAVDILKAAVILPFLFRIDLTGIYVLLVLLSALDTVYGPSRRKFILRLTGKKGVLGANSLLTGASGIAYLIGPLAAGILTDAYGPSPAFAASMAACGISAAATLLVRPGGPAFGRRQPKDILSEMAAGFDYSRRAPKVREVIQASVITGFCAVAVNMAFYPYAFDTLKVTAKGWSLMISIYYGTNLMALPVMDFLGSKRKRPGFRLFYGGLFLTGLIWLSYAFICGFSAVLLLQFTEGTILAVCGILLSSRMQLVSDARFLARVAGVADILSGGARLLAMGFAFLTMGLASFRPVFMATAALLLAFSLYNLMGRREDTLAVGHPPPL